MIDAALLLGAIGGLAGAIGVLWRQLLSERASHERDKREAARLIFALLGERSRRLSMRPPPTESTPETPKLAEAAQLASDALADDLDGLLRAYLESERPPR